MDTRAQARAVVPNIIHSYDASHLLMTAIRFCNEDRYLSGVHDSYGTHACDVDQLAKDTREAFV